MSLLVHQGRTGTKAANRGNRFSSSSVSLFCLIRKCLLVMFGELNNTNTGNSLPVTLLPA